MPKSGWIVPPPVYLHINDESFWNFCKFSEDGTARRMTTYAGRKYLLVHRDGIEPDDIRRLLAKYGCEGLICCSPETLPEDLRRRHVLPFASGKISVQSGGTYLHVFQGEAT